MADYSVKFTHSTNVLAKEASKFIRTGTEIYRHPKGYFATLEFEGKGGKFRESFELRGLMPV